jgi:hypothetical protein
MHEEKRSRLSSLFTNGSCYLTLVDISVKYQTEEKLIKHTKYMLLDFHQRKQELYQNAHKNIISTNGVIIY